MVLNRASAPPSGSSARGRSPIAASDPPGLITLLDGYTAMSLNVNQQLLPQAHAAAWQGDSTWDPVFGGNW